MTFSKKQHLNTGPAPAAFAARGSKTERRILVTATALFGKHGFDGVSTTEISRKARVNKALIFYYFGSKDGLYQAAFRNLLENFTGKIKERIGTVEPGLETVAVFMREHIAFFKRRHEMVTFMVRELLGSGKGTSPGLKAYEDIFTEIRTTLIGAISQARIKGEIRDVDPLQAIVSILSLDVFFFFAEPMVKLLYPGINLDDFVDKRVDHVLDLLLNGLRKTVE